jgi:hypothetical protein
MDAVKQNLDFWSMNPKQPPRIQKRASFADTVDR